MKQPANTASARVANVAHELLLSEQKRGNVSNEVFRKFAGRCSIAVGSPRAFLIAVAIVVIWALAGPMFHYSDSWQLIINTGTTIVTFLMVFLIQNSQNRDAKAIHLKLDELIRGVRDARTGLVDLEHCTDAELAALEDDFRRVRARERVPPIDEMIAAAEEPPPRGAHSGKKGARGDPNEDRADAGGRAEGKPGG